MKEESDSYFLLESAVVTLFTTCADDLDDGEPFFLEDDGVLSPSTAMKRCGFHFSLGTLMLRRTTSVCGPSFFTIFQRPFGRSKSD